MPHKVPVMPFGLGTHGTTSLGASAPGRGPPGSGPQGPANFPVAQAVPHSLNVSINVDGEDPNVVRLPRDIAVGLLNDTAARASHITAAAVVSQAQEEFRQASNVAEFNHATAINQIKAEAERRHADTINLIGQQLSLIHI